MRARLGLTGLVLALMLPLGSCELLQQASMLNQPGQMPTVVYQGAVLVEAPSRAMMAAYYCPQILADQLGFVPPLNDLTCNGFFGPKPAPDQMHVSFELAFVVNNPNNFPIPMAELLTAVTVFPAATNQSLGAVCIKFCDASVPNCTGAPDPTSCKASGADIHNLDDFKAAAAGLLVSTGVTLLAGQQPSFQMPQVLSGSEIVIKTRFSFGPEALLTALVQLASQAAGQLQNGNTPEFKIPYRLEGTAWFDVGSLGRIALAFGPSTGVWEIPQSALVP